MTHYKIVEIRGNYGDIQIGFVIDGKVKDLPMVGRVWRWSDYNNWWDAKATVVESKVAGQLRYEAFKSRVAKPLTLAAGEVYLPISVTGRAVTFKTLPSVE